MFALDKASAVTIVNCAKILLLHRRIPLHRDVKVSELRMRIVETLLILKDFQ